MIVLAILVKITYQVVILVIVVQCVLVVMGIISLWLGCVKSLKGRLLKIMLKLGLNLII